MGDRGIVRGGRGPCKQIDVRHDPAQFNQTARHVVARRHHNQALEIVLAHPRQGFFRITAGVLGAIVDRYAAREEIRVDAGEAAQVPGRDDAIDAADEKVAGALLAQEVACNAQPLGPRR